MLISLEQTSNPEHKALLYSQIAKAYQSKNTDTAFYFAFKGLELSENENYKYGLAENAAVLADLFVINNELEKAKEYYSTAIMYFYETQNYFDCTQTSMVKANIFLVQDKYFDALQLYQSCLTISHEKGFTSIIPHLYNNIGVLYLNLNEYDEAFPYFEKAYTSFNKANDEFNKASALNNLVAIHLKRNEDSIALIKSFDIIVIFLKLEKWTDLSYAYNSIANIYIDQQEYKKAKEYVNLAMNINENYKSEYLGPTSSITTSIYSNVAFLHFIDKEYDKSILFARLALQQSLANSYLENAADNAFLLGEIFEELNQPDSALAYYKYYMKNWISLEKEGARKKIMQLNMQAEKELLIKNNELQNREREIVHKQKESFYKALIIISLLIAIILILLYFTQKSKTTRALLRRENLQLEKDKLNRELEYKNKELTTNMMYLLEKNEFITSIARRLDEFKILTKTENKVLVQQIINELKHNVSKEIWEEFELHFKEVHAEFYDSLNKSFPNLTLNEKRLCAFLRLNMTTKEISSITHQSIKSINVARTRLRKKMDMDKDESLISFLTQL